jgi:3-oxoacid CoA-transferase subunit A
VDPGELDPEHIHTPGIFVQRVVLAANAEKRIEKRTVALARPGQAASAHEAGSTRQAGA